MSYLSSGSRFRVEAVASNSEIDALRVALRSDFLAAAAGRPTSKSWHPRGTIRCSASGSERGRTAAPASLPPATIYARPVGVNSAAAAYQSGRS